MSGAALRAAALAAALVLAVLSRGDVVVLALLLSVAAWRPLPATAIASALAATAWRWSSTSLEDIAGAQAVLGPAGLVDPRSAAASAWLGALAILLATPNLVLAREVAGPDRADDPEAHPTAVVLRWLPRVASAAAAAVVVAGPAPGGDLWARALAAALGLALIIQVQRRLRHQPRLVEGAAAVAGLASFVAVGIDAPALEGAFSTDAFVQGTALAVAVGLLAWVAGTAAVHARRLSAHP